MANPKILIIDDDPDIVEAMRMPLEANDYEVISANCGKEGLQKSKRGNSGFDNTRCNDGNRYGRVSCCL